MATITSIIHQKHRGKDRAQRHAPQRGGGGEGRGGGGGGGEGESYPAPGTSQSKAQAETALLTAEHNLAMARNTHAALRKELAAVAATAPRKKSSFWQNQAQAHVQMHADAEVRVQALLTKAKHPLYRSPSSGSSGAGTRARPLGKPSPCRPMCAAGLCASCRRRGSPG